MRSMPSKTSSNSKPITTKSGSSMTSFRSAAWAEANAVADRLPLLRFRNSAAKASDKAHDGGHHLRGWDGRKESVHGRTSQFGDVALRQCARIPKEMNHQSPYSFSSWRIRRISLERIRSSGCIPSDIVIACACSPVALGSWFNPRRACRAATVCRRSRLSSASPTRREPASTAIVASGRTRQRSVPSPRPLGRKAGDLGSDPGSHVYRRHWCRNAIILQPRLLQCLTPQTRLS